METSSIVLAGGRSARLGHDKVSITIGNRNLLDLVLNWMASLSQEVILVTAGEQRLPELNKRAKVKVVADIYPDKGPLGGIYTGLVASASFYNLVVASDMPFLNPALLRYMLQVSANFDIVVPRTGNLVEPLHAIYSKNCLSPMEPMLKQNELAISQLFPKVKTRYVENEEIERFDPNHLSFFNINTRADWLKAEKIAKDIGCYDKR